jgi:hypothetical protein
MPNGHGEGETPEHELPEAGDEEEQREELEREAEHVRDEANEHVREAMTEITTTSGETTVRIVDITFRQSSALSLRGERVIPRRRP